MFLKKPSHYLIAILLLTIMLSAGCLLEGIEETFDESDRPVLEYNTAGRYYLVKPWNYEKSYNSNKKYPLLIYLHGAQLLKRVHR